MATQTEQIAASQQRHMIPKEWLTEFNDWTNTSLSSLAGDEQASRDIRAWAGWELDYRMAFGIEVADLPIAGDVRPFTQERAEAVIKQRMAEQD